MAFLLRFPTRGPHANPLAHDRNNPDWIKALSNSEESTGNLTASLFLKNKKSIASDICGADEIIAISEKGRMFFEEYCSSEIQIRPLNIVSHNGHPIDGNFYFFKPITYLKSIIMKPPRFKFSGEVINMPNSDSLRCCAFYPQGTEKPECRRDIVADHNIWRERFPGTTLPPTRYIFISNGTKELMQRHKMKGVEEFIEIVEI